MKAEVYNNQVSAGILERTKDGKYVFTYHQSYLDNSLQKSISLTLPKQSQPFTSDFLFPFFSGLLSEGINKDIQCRLLKIDEEDEFGRLLATGAEDSIGAITIKRIRE